MPIQGVRLRSLPLQGGRLGTVPVWSGRRCTQRLLPVFMLLLLLALSRGCHIEVKGGMSWHWFRLVLVVKLLLLPLLKGWCVSRVTSS